MKVKAQELLKKAKYQKKAIPAFNVSSIEALQAVFEGAREKKGDIIIETSIGESEHLTPELISSISEKLSKIHHVNYALHLDRCDNLMWIKRCLRAGYNSISAEFKVKNCDDNVRLSLLAREITSWYGAHLEGVMEIVPLLYYKDKIKSYISITDPRRAKEFVETVRCDSLVISIGNQSGRYKHIKDLRIDILEKCNKLIPYMPFVLHGGSFMKKEIIKKLIRNGIAKININSELRIAYTKRLKKNLRDNPDEYAPYRLLKGSKEEMKKIVIEKIQLFQY